jgi:hypothetical protein
VIERLTPKVVDQIDQLLTREFIALVEVDLVRENAIELRLVCTLYRDHRFV